MPTSVSNATGWVRPSTKNVRQVRLRESRPMPSSWASTELMPARSLGSPVCQLHEIHVQHARHAGVGRHRWRRQVS